MCFPQFPFKYGRVNICFGFGVSRTVTYDRSKFVITVHRFAKACSEFSLTFLEATWTDFSS